MPTNATSPSCHGSGPLRQGIRQRPFLSAPYLAGDDGRYAPAEALDQCPFAEGGEPCRLEKHDWRPRKSGPAIALRVLRCRTHGVFFTVYPPGYVPYGRQRLAAVDLQGAPLVRELPESEASLRGCLLRGGPGCGRSPPVAA